MQYLYDERGRRYLDVRPPSHAPACPHACMHADAACRTDTVLVAPMQAFAGIVTVSVGHCHPGVVSAVQAQLNRLMHTTTIYLHNEIAQYAKELTDRLPGNLKVCGHTVIAT